MNGFDSFFKRYAERYMAADADAIAATYEAPVLAVRDADGGLVRDFRATYHLLRGDATWRILSYTNHDA